MGDRYILEITCPKCGLHDSDVAFAPTCGFTKWYCETCGHKIDLVKYMGISRKDASNADEIQEIISKLAPD